MEAEILNEETRVVRGENRVCILALTWEEAYQGCTRSVTVDDREVPVQVPPRSRDGRSIWLAGQGGVGQNGGKAGDLSVRLSVDDPPDDWSDEAELTLTPNPLPDTGGPGDVSPDAILEIVQRMATLPVAVPGEETALAAPASSPAAKAGSRKSPLAVFAAALVLLVAACGVAFAFKWLPPRQAAAAAPAPVAIRICTDSGRPAGPSCPHTELRTFAPGTEPQGVCETHQSLLVRICKKSGQLASAHCPADQVENRSFPAGEAPTKPCSVHRGTTTSAPVPSVRFCGVCGAPLGPGVKFCGRCGHPTGSQ